MYVLFCMSHMYLCIYFSTSETDQNLLCDFVDVGSSSQEAAFVHVGEEEERDVEGRVR
jgi:hypothetical protein